MGYSGIRLVSISFQGGILGCFLGRTEMSPAFFGRFFFFFRIYKKESVFILIFLLVYSKKFKFWIS